MPFPRSRLDSFIVFKHTSLQTDDLEVQFQRWVLNGYISRNGERGVNYSEFGLGAFRKVVIIQSDTPKLYANHQGGYRVFCPVNDKIVTVDFTNGVARWRGLHNEPQENQVHCSGCNQSHSLVEFFGKPNFAFGRSAFHFQDIEIASFNDSLLREVEINIDSCSLVFKRVG